MLAYSKKPNCFARLERFSTKSKHWFVKSSTAVTKQREFLSCPLDGHRTSGSLRSRAELGIFSFFLPFMSFIGDYFQIFQKIYFRMEKRKIVQKLH